MLTYSHDLELVVLLNSENAIQGNETVLVNIIKNTTKWEPDLRELGITSGGHPNTCLRQQPTPTQECMGQDHVQQQNLVATRPIQQ